MKEQPFDFEKETPPVLTEKMLRQENERRRLIKQIRLLRIVAVSIVVCLAVSAFIVLKSSFILFVLCIAFLFVYTSGYAFISVLFYAKGYNRNE